VAEQERVQQNKPAVKPANERPKTMSETCEKVTITPALAKEILEEQERRIAEGEHNNRPTNKASIAKYVNDIRRGHWTVNTSGIGFDTRGNLTNGRNRLWAIVEAGRPVTTWVMRGLNAKGNGVVSSMDTEDNGRTRTVASQLHIDGLKYPELLSASVRVIAMMLTNDATAKVSIIPAREILDIYQTHLMKTLELCGARNRSLRGYILAPLAIYRAKDRAKADEFAAHWNERANLPSNSPILALQRYMEAQHGRTGRDELVSRYRHTSLALYHFDAGARVNTIRNSDIGCEWLRNLTPGNTRKVLDILGVDETVAS
jgi:hypothetical protein